MTPGVDGRSPESGKKREEIRREAAAELDGEILTAIGRGWRDPLPESEFDALARTIFAHQFRFNPVYRQFCLMRDVGAPADVASWREIPPVPAGAFKVGRWATFPPEAEVAAFRTSGTTRGTAGIHSFETLSLYNAAIVPAARRFLVPDRERIRFLFLSPPPAAVPDSSLVHMFAVYREALGAPGSRFLLTGQPGPEALRLDALVSALDLAEREEEPIAVAGAALAFHHTLPALESRSWRLPEGSRVMVTGGFKGVRAEADPEALASRIASRLGVSRGFQVGEYGMTELSSQHYTAALRSRLGLDPATSDRDSYRSAPWTRVRIVDPMTGEDLPPGEEGALVHVDLANRASAVVVQTSDLGTRTSDGGFVLRGRSPEAEARGCSLAADLWLGET